MENTNATVPYFVHEGALNRMERVNRRLWIAVLVLVLALIGTNAGWIAYESQFEDIYIEQEGETDGGGSNYFNGTGQVNYYGESEAGY